MKTLNYLRQFFILMGLGIVLTMAATKVFAADPATFTRDAIYPVRCSGDGHGVTGVCVLGSRWPEATNLFIVIDADTGRFVDDVYLNSVRPLDPGDYMLMEADAPWAEYRYPFTVTEGKVTNIKTATLSLRIDGVVDLQGAHDEEIDGICMDMKLIEVLSEGNWAYIPGDYVLDFGSEVRCSGNEMEITLEEGKVTFVKIAR